MNTKAVQLLLYGLLDQIPGCNDNTCNVCHRNREAVTVLAKELDIPATAIMPHHLRGDQQ